LETELVRSLAQQGPFVIVALLVLWQLLSGRRVVLRREYDDMKEQRDEWRTEAQELRDAARGAVGVGEALTTAARRRRT
jgi:hypothetical protein